MQGIVMDGKLKQFTGQYSGERGALEILTFLGRHPYTWFSVLSIVHALDARKPDVVEAIEYLIQKGMLKSRANDGGLPLYSLAENSPSHDLVLELAARDLWE